VVNAGYNPQSCIDRDPELRAAVDLIESGLFSHGDRDLFRLFLDALTRQDRYLACADFRAYADCQEHVGLHYRDQEHWTQMSIFNVARIGCFSSDRAIREYCRDIWKVKPVSIPAVE